MYCVIVEKMYRGVICQNAISSSKDNLGGCVYLEITSNSAMLCDEGRVEGFPEVLSGANFHRVFSGVFVALCRSLPSQLNQWKFAIKRGSQEAMFGFACMPRGKFCDPLGPIFASAPII